jgi:Bacterial regulatory proteins, luxR family
VVELLARGSTGEEIAALLEISLETVRGRIQAILTKLGVHSRLEAAAFMLRPTHLRRPRSRPRRLSPSRSSGLRMFPDTSVSLCGEQAARHCKWSDPLGQGCACGRPESEAERVLGVRGRAPQTMGGRQVGSGSSLSDVPAWFQHMGDAWCTVASRLWSTPRHSRAHDLRDLRVTRSSSTSASCPLRNLRTPRCAGV